MWFLEEKYKKYMKAIPWLLLVGIAVFMLFFRGGEKGNEILLISSGEAQVGGNSTAGLLQGGPDLGPGSDPAASGVADHSPFGQEEPLDIYVDVAGAVVSPGVQCLPAGSRVFEAVEMAGGLRTDSDTREVNLALLLSDGQKIFIPTVKEQEAASKAAGKTAGDTYIPSAGGAVSTAEGSGESPADQVNINTDNKDELQKLTGVGPSMAEKILEYRREHGDFKKAEDLKKVKGIGEKTFEKLKDSIYVP